MRSHGPGITISRQKSTNDSTPRFPAGLGNSTPLRRLSCLLIFWERTGWADRRSCILLVGLDLGEI